MHNQGVLPTAIPKKPEMICICMWTVKLMLHHRFGCTLLIIC